MKRTTTQARLRREDPILAYGKDLLKVFRTGSATEHSYRPALRSFLQSLDSSIEAVNDPRRVDCGAPDFIVYKGSIPVGYIETKDIGKSLNRAENSEQLHRYRAGLRNLILTDYLDFRWYVNGVLRDHVRLGNIRKGSLRLLENGPEKLQQLLGDFINADTPVIRSADELANRLAGTARSICRLIKNVYDLEDGHGWLHRWLKAFTEVLIADLDRAEFADMFAQTLVYGFFAARASHTSKVEFSRFEAARLLPTTNPFLRQLFNEFVGLNMPEEISWAVDEVIELLKRTDMKRILRDFTSDTGKEDPVVHFYETFLVAYDPGLRKRRGVYYTPDPVVDYMVRSVETILVGEFGKEEGLADDNALILDPAVGTASFLRKIINVIRARFRKNKGAWDHYVSDTLLEKIFGFEILMAPYAVAHLKLGLELRESGYSFRRDRRLGVFLTNTLEDTARKSQEMLFDWISKEANAASSIKKDKPIMVVIGNPPYSGESANKTEWIFDLLRGYDSITKEKTANYFECDGAPLGERNPKWLNDDYVKFIRFAQWRIEKTGYGVLAFVTNHGYLDNPTFRGMRQSLIETFDTIYLLDLHGSSKRKEKALDGGKDENVFDIQQGVAIGLFVKHSDSSKKRAAVYHADIYGTREKKYSFLLKSGLSSIRWKKVKPSSPFYLFVPQDERARAEYDTAWKITDIMPINNTGMVSKRDSLAFQFEKDSVLKVVKDIYNLTPSEIVEKYPLSSWSSRDGKVEFVKKSVKEFGVDKSRFVTTLYRPFDSRWTYYTPKSKGFIAWPVFDVMQHMLAGDNYGLATTRSVEIERGWEHMLCTDELLMLHSVSVKEVNYLFPLYLYPKADSDLFESAGHASGARDRRPNLSEEFIAELSSRLKLKFVSDGRGDLAKTFGPDDVFNYAYAVFYSPTYRGRYAEFLRIDFPRLPLTSNQRVFRRLCVLGMELVALHLRKKIPKLQSSYPVAGNNVIDSIRYIAPSGRTSGRVWINKAQYFDGVPQEVWEYHIGGYQVCRKWLKDRKGRELAYEDLKHYRGIISVLARTIEIQTEIDKAIGKWPIQ